MEIEFNYIRNRIAEHNKDALLEEAYKILAKNINKPFPIWHVFTLMKWALLYGGGKYPSKLLTPKRFANIYNNSISFSDTHISSFLKKGEIDKAFQIIHYQQFYLQRSVYNEVFATQLKLFSTIEGKYNIEKSFKDKTGISILDFLFISKLMWIYINEYILKKPILYFDENINKDFVNAAREIVDVETVSSFVRLLTLHPHNTDQAIEKFRHKIKKESWQTMEMTFFTIFPLQLFKGNIKLVHPSVFNHTVNYYLYDYLKNNDDLFTTEFGNRLEKYISLGLSEIGLHFTPESKLRNILPAKAKLVDFYLPDDNIYIECKAIEMQAYSSINPTDDLLYSSFKTSLFKAYFEQICSVSRMLSADEENFGIIITYKEVFWGDFSKLYLIGKESYNNNFDNDHVPPSNVFIIDIYTWDLVIQVVKDGKIALIDLLKLAKKNNSSPETLKLLFRMHLEEFEPIFLNLNYLNDENKRLDVSS